MRSALELKVLRAGTSAFIAANPVNVALIPRLRLKSGTGTTFQDQTPRTEQTFALLDQSTSRNTWPGRVQTSDGAERLVDFILLGEHDMKIALWDYWRDADGGILEVTEIYPANGYETRASVVRRA